MVDVSLFATVLVMIGTNPKTGVCQPVPRHREVKEPLAKHIIKMLED